MISHHRRGPRAGFRRAYGCLLAALSLPSFAVDLQFTRIGQQPRVTDIRHAGDGSDRLFIVGQTGRVDVLRDGVFAATPFLDIGDRLSSGNERGLLSLAFAPDFAVSGDLYAWYTRSNGDAVLSRFHLEDPSSDVTDPGSEQILLVVEQPFSNHNGGRLQFGPDGYLYLGIGDGGSGGDPQGHGQNPDTLLGSLIRIDVDPAHGAYAIPNDNPFIDTPGADEIWATGLRNPWRISFDRLTGELFIADVGQNATEEINVQPATGGGGRNYGWNIMEGGSCYLEPNCDPDGLTLPVAEYDHAQGCSVTGGEVYRGNAYPALQGTYLYGDFCSGTIWGLYRTGEGWNDAVLARTGFGITTFGEGEDGSLYLAAAGDGVYLISDGEPVTEPPFRINAGLNDAWMTPGVPGQGILIAVFPSLEQVFAAWFTFETARPGEDVMAHFGGAGQRWLTALGPYAGTTAELQVELTAGGEFDAGQPAPTQSPYGTLRLEFTGCNAGSVTWFLPAAGLEGQATLSRVSVDNVGLCEALSAP